MFALRRACAFALIAVAVSRADTIIGFEQFSDGDRLTNQIPGLEFTNVTVATAGISLNEFEFPPHSGANAAFDDGGPVTLSFPSPILSFEGFFTYSAPLTLQGFDGGNTLLASAVSLFSSNLALSGDPGSSPNEFLRIASDSGFDRITITGSSGGGSFVMDDLSFQSSVPEPKTYALVFAGLLFVLAFRPRCASQKH